MARVVIAGWVGSSNLGDELVLKALLRKLRDREATIVAISTDPAATRRDHRIHAVDHRRLDAIDRLIAGADVLVFGGGGLLQDETSRFNLPYHLSRIGNAKARKIPFAMVGMGVGPLRTNLGHTLVRKAFDGAVLGSVRDRDSGVVLEAMGLDRPELAADLALSLLSPVVAAEDRIGVSLRPWHGGSALPVAATWRKGLDEDDWFAPAMARALDEVAARTGLGIHLIAFQAGRDDRVNQQVAGLMKTPATMASPTLDGILDEVGRCRAMISLRYHGAIAATLAHRPSVLVGYSDKVTSLAHDLGEGARGIDRSPEGLDALPDALDAVLGKDEEVAAMLRHLRVRELGNDDAIDRLLAAAASR